MIFKIVRKSMHKKVVLLISILTLVLLSSMFIGIRYFTYDSLEYNNNAMMEESNPEDFRMYQIKVFEDYYTEEFEQQLMDDYDIVVEDKQKVIHQSMDEEDVTSFTITAYDPDQKINTLIIQEGSAPVNAGEILVQPGYIDHVNEKRQAELGEGESLTDDQTLKIGDEFVINDQTYTISGSGYMVEYIVPVEYEMGMIYPNFDTFTPVYMNQESFEQLDLDDITLDDVSYYAATFNQSMSHDEEMEQFDIIMEENQIEIPRLDENGVPQIDLSTGEVVVDSYNLIPFIMGADMNPNIASVEGEIEGSRGMFSFLATVLTILTICLAIVLVNSVFKAQRREMGILKAEGVSIGKLSFGFTLYLALLLIVGSIIGTIASIALSRVLIHLYDSMFQIYFYPLQTNVIFNVASNLIIVGVISVVLVYVLSIRRNLHQPTLNLVKNIDNDKQPKNNVTRIFNKLPFLHKYQMNLIFRNFSKTVLLFFGILVSSFLLLMGTLMYTTMDKMINDVYFDVFTYEYLVQYSNGVEVDDTADAYITTKPLLVSVPDEAELDEPLDDESTFTLEAYEMGEANYVLIKDRDGEFINEPEGLVPTEGFMKNYNLEIGDEIVVQNPYDLNDEVTLEIVNTTPDFFLPFVYADVDYIQEKFGLDDDYVNASYFGDELTNERREEIDEIDPQAFVFETIDVQAQMESYMGIFLTMIAIIAGFAGLIAFISLYSISSVIIDSNRKTISVMKVLGYTDKEVRRMTIGIYKWFVIVIYIALIPFLQFAIQSVIDYALRDADFVLYINLDLFIAFLGLVVIFTVYLISSKLTYQKISKIRLSESLKADE